MKYVKILGLLAVAAAALMAFAGTASATKVTSGTGTVATPSLTGKTENGHAVLHNPIAKIECESAVSGKVESHGGNGVPAAGKISSLSFSPCTNDWHVTVVTPGSLSVNWTSGYNGDAFSSGATVEATRFGVSCRYKTENTTIGTVTGGTPATLDISASIPFHSGSFLCGSGATVWTGNYVLTSPSSLFLDKE